MSAHARVSARRRGRATLLLCLVSIALAAASACSGGGGSSSNGSPTPTGSGTPNQPDHCQIVFTNPDSTNPAHYEAFMVDAPVASWVSGTMNYSVSPVLGIFYYDYDPVTKLAAVAGVTTAGSFDVTLGNGTTAAGSVAFSDTTSQDFYAFDQTTGAVSGKIATNGTGSFSGQWSNPAPASPTGGSGNVTVMYLNTSFALGGDQKYAQCYASTAFATRAQRYQAALDAAIRAR